MENLDHVSEFMPLVTNQAVDVVEIGRGASGFTGGLQVADLAYAFEIPVSVMNCPGNFAAHFAAALPTTFGWKCWTRGGWRALQWTAASPSFVIYNESDFGGIDNIEQGLFCTKSR